MASIEMDFRSVELQHLGDQKAEFAIAQDGDFGSAPDGDLIKDFAGGGDGFDEHSKVGRDVFGNAMEIDLGEGEVFGEGAGVFDDAEDGAVGAMAAEGAAADTARAASKIDFPDDGLASPFGVVAFDDFSHEFMAWGAGKAVVAALEMQIRAADSSMAHADQGLARLGRLIDRKSVV